MVLNSLCSSCWSETCGSSASAPWYCRCAQHMFKFDEVPFLYFFICCLCFWCHMQEITANFSIMKLLNFKILVKSFSSLNDFLNCIHKAKCSPSQDARPSDNTLSHGGLSSPWMMWMCCVGRRDPAGHSTLRLFPFLPGKQPKLFRGYLLSHFPETWVDSLVCFWWSVALGCVSDLLWPFLALILSFGMSGVVCVKCIYKVCIWSSLWTILSFIIFLFRELLN
jgi:hypothetical protein